MKKLALFLVMMAGSIIFTYAQTATPVSNQKQVTQRQRIKQGVRSGELTQQETRRLMAEQRHIYREKNRAACDGVITLQERSRIRMEQQIANSNIYRKKNNHQNRIR